VRADEKLTAFMELESAIRSATRRKSACYENLPPDRGSQALPSDYDRPALWQNLSGLSNPICAAAQPSRANRIRAEFVSEPRPARLVSE